MPGKYLLLLCLSSALFLASCNSNSGEKKEETPNIDSKTTEKETTSSSTGNPGAERARMSVTLTGGEMAGTYTAICRDACCSWGIAGENVFGNQYSETGKGPKELSSFQLIVDNITQGNKTSNEFTMTVSFGELFSESGKNFNINTKNGKNDGSGTVTVNYEGEKATVTIKGTTKEGPAIDLTMTCNKVMTVNNLGQ